jgi:uncharacterized damage-inducible protein DinB
MLKDMPSYLTYLNRVRERTLLALDRIPADQLAWTPRAGEFTLGDIARHFGASEQMFVDAALGAGWHYPGHRAEIWGVTLDDIRAKLERTHTDALARLRSAGDAALNAKQPDLKGNPISAWRMLMLLIEHEIHHRSQLDTYLMLLGVEPPQVFGVKMEALPQD